MAVGGRFGIDWQLQEDGKISHSWAGTSHLRVTYYTALEHALDREFTGWKSRLTRTSWRSKNTNAKSCTSRGLIHCNRSQDACLESKFAGKDLGVLVDNRLNRTQKCAFVVKKVTSVLGQVHAGQLTDWRKWLFPTIQLLWERYMENCVEHWTPQHKNVTDVLEQPGIRYSGGWSMWHLRKELVNSTLRKEVYQCLMEGCIGS